MSKRIMNEVHDVAHNEKIFIAYQDTDSIHLVAGPNNINIKKLADAYDKKYPGRKIVGKYMGQFHCDFNISDNGKKEVYDYEKKCLKTVTEDFGTSNVRSEDSYFLGKKMYMHSLVGRSNVTGKVLRKEHIRMKGIPSYCLDSSAKEDFEFLKTGKQKLYEISNIAKLKNRPIFKYGKDYQISDNTSMKRSVRCYSKVKTIEI